MLTLQRRNMEELQSEGILDILQSVIERQQILTVVLPSGKEVVIQPQMEFQPLPVLEGKIPLGWRDALYDEFR